MKYYDFFSVILWTSPTLRAHSRRTNRSWRPSKPPFSRPSIRPSLRDSPTPIPITPCRDRLWSSINFVRFFLHFKGMVLSYEMPQLFNWICPWKMFLLLIVKLIYFVLKVVKPQQMYDEMWDHEKRTWTDLTLKLCQLTISSARTYTANFVTQKLNFDIKTL